MADSILYCKDPSQTAHRMGGEKDGRIKFPQQIGEDIEGEIMASHHHHGIQDFFQGLKEFNLCFFILIQTL